MTGDARPVLARTSDGYEVYGGKCDGVYVIAERGGPVVGAFYAVPGWPNWWRGHTFGKVRQVFQPGDFDPLAVAERFVSR
jgi:hypothetical protein